MPDKGVTCLRNPRSLEVGVLRRHHLLTAHPAPSEGTGVEATDWTGVVSLHLAFSQVSF